MNNLLGQVALVTGASRGLGKGIALVLAQQGADVAVNYRSSESEALEVCKAITDMGRRALPIKADVGNEADEAKLFDDIKKGFGKLDILVNNAGTTQAKDIFQITPADWEFIIRTNLTSAFLCSRKAFELMREQKHGRIVFISSISGQQGALYGHAHYSATKSGMFGMVKALARTGAPLGINVNAVAPGIIETELLFQTHGNDGVKTLAEKVPLGLGTQRDIGLAVAFLCGEGGRYITGATLDVNGGMYLR